MTDWTTCEGSAPKRRELFAAPLAAALALWAGRSALAQIQVGPERGGDVLITIFLRGGMDGLSMLVPHGDDDYHKARPTVGLGRPKRGGVLDLDGFFGLHPSLAPLLPLFREGKMAGIHAIGSQDQSRSHFEAMATMERGAAGVATEISSGWLARALTATDNGKNVSPLRAVAFAPVMPDILRGATGASALGNLSELRLALPKEATPQLESTLKALYARGSDPVTRAGRETLSVLETLKRLDPKSYRPERGASYPESGLGLGLQQTALLIKANVGLEAAALDLGGWDTHVAQGAGIGYLASSLGDVATSLAAFATDLGPERLKRITCVVMTEFGRRVAENSGLGTDHGRASAWLVLGGHLSDAGGGKVHARWPGLAPAKLEAPGDLAVTTDYRDVLAELLTRRMKTDGRAIFPTARGEWLNFAADA